MLILDLLTMKHHETFPIMSPRITIPLYNTRTNRIPQLRASSSIISLESSTLGMQIQPVSCNITIPTKDHLLSITSEQRVLEDKQRKTIILTILNALTQWWLHNNTKSDNSIKHKNTQPHKSIDRGLSVNNSITSPPMEQMPKSKWWTE